MSQFTGSTLNSRTNSTIPVSAILARTESRDSNESSNDSVIINHRLANLQLNNSTVSSEAPHQKISSSQLVPTLKPESAVPLRRTPPTTTTSHPQQHVPQQQQQQQQQAPNTLLSFNVTPPKSVGPSEAERKVEEWERQIEEQMEKEEQAICFGKRLKFAILIQSAFENGSKTTS